MVGVHYTLADYRTGGPILDLPVMEGADWAALLNRPDALSCSIDMRDPAAKALDLRSATEPRKTVLRASNDDDVTLAWGLIDDDRVWDEDQRTLAISARGVWSSSFGNSIVAPAAALSADLVVDDIANPALDTYVVGWDMGTVGKKLVAQRLAWPGSPVYSLPPDAPGNSEEEYLFTSMKRVGSALTDLTNRESGVDFAFDAARGPDGLALVYSMRHGTEASPSLGVRAFDWSLGGQTPITKLKVRDSADDLATAAWGIAGRTTGSILISRALNDDLVTASGYPPIDSVDTSHGNVALQDTLDSYTRASANWGRTSSRSLSFTVRGDAAPGLGSFRPGDTGALSVPTDHVWLSSDIMIRITGMSGDETGREIKIECDVIV